MSRIPVRSIVVAALVAAPLAACGGGDGGGAGDTSIEQEDAAAATTVAATAEIQLTGLLQIDVTGPTSTNCVYIEDAALGRVYLNPVGDFEGLFRATTDGSDPDYLVELVTADAVLIEKGTTVAVTATADFSQMRCTQGDETEVSVTALAPA